MHYFPLAAAASMGHLANSRPFSKSSQPTCIWDKSGFLCPNSPFKKGLSSLLLASTKLTLKMYWEACKNSQSCDIPGLGKGKLNCLLFQVENVPTFMEKTHSYVSCGGLFPAQKGKVPVFHQP